MKRLLPSGRLEVFETIAILGLMLVAGLARVFAYGDLRLSVGNEETQSYVASATSPLLSWRIFAGPRLFTTNLIYKLADDPTRCKLLALSDPAGGREARPIVQPCFENIALLQNWLAILGWCYFAWTTARWMRHFVAKVGIAAAILAFGFVPQIAEWDSILSPESLSITLFVVLIALLEDIGFAFAREKSQASSRRVRILIAAWLLVFVLWVFIRDVHLVTVPITLAMAAVLLSWNHAWRQKGSWALVGLLAGLFVLGYASAQSSHRATHYPLVHSFEDYILPFPARVQFFKGFGMPDPPSGPAYEAWLDSNATRTYSLFLLTHPGFVTTQLAQNVYDFRAQLVQQYFTPANAPNRPLFIELGEIVHPETLAVYWIDFLALVVLGIAARRRDDPTLRWWAWIGTWCFLCSSVTLMASFFGDAEGARRHIFPSVEGFRLLMWLLLFACFDAILGGQNPTPKSADLPAPESHGPTASAPTSP